MTTSACCSTQAKPRNLVVLSGTMRYIGPLLLAAVALLHLIPPVNSLYDEDSTVVRLTEESFRKSVFHSDKVWIVKYYTPWCAHCQSFASDFEEAAKDLKDVVKFGAVNCDEEPDLAKEHGVTTYPVVKIFGYDKTSPTIYRSLRSAHALKKSALDALNELESTKQSSSKPHSEGTEKPKQKAHSQKRTNTESPREKPAPAAANHKTNDAGETADPSDASRKPELHQADFSKKQDVLRSPTEGNPERHTVSETQHDKQPLQKQQNQVGHNFKDFEDTAKCSAQNDNSQQHFDLDAYQEAKNSEDSNAVPRRNNALEKTPDTCSKTANAVREEPSDAYRNHEDNVFAEKPAKKNALMSNDSSSREPEKQPGNTTTLETQNEELTNVADDANAMDNNYARDQFSVNATKLNAKESGNATEEPDDDQPSRNKNQKTPESEEREENSHTNPPGDDKISANHEEHPETKKKNDSSLEKTDDKTSAQESDQEDANSDGGVVTLTDANFNKTVMASNDAWLVEFYAPWCKHCRDFAPVYEKIARTLKGKVKAGAYDCDSNEKIANQHNIEGFPSIKLFPPGPKDASEVLDHEITGDPERDVVRWVNDRLAEVIPAPKVTQLTDQETFDEACVRKQLCIFSVLPHILDCNAECRNGYLDVLKKLSGKYKKTRWGWLWTEPGAYEKLEKTLELGGAGFPAMATISMKKTRYAGMRGSFSFTGIDQFLESLYKGGEATTFFKPDEFAKIQPNEPWDGQDAKTPVSDYDDSEDADTTDKDEL